MVLTIFGYGQAFRPPVKMRLYGKAPARTEQRLPIGRGARREQPSGEQTAGTAGRSFPFSGRPRKPFGAKPKLICPPNNDDTIPADFGQKGAERYPKPKGRPPARLVINIMF
jgi:hypothetical protein